MIYTIRTFPLEFPPEEAETCLVGIPWDSSEIGRSVKFGPLFIRQALKEIEGFDPESGEDLFEKTKFCDLGDVEVVPSNWPLTKARILDTIGHIFKANPRTFPVFLGGDHLITLGILEGLKKQAGDFTVIHIDAHRDLSKGWEGEKYSHISWGYHAIKELGLGLVQLGVRSSTKEESRNLKELDVKETLEGVEGPAYLTVDLDVLDPGFAPEVGTPEPLGTGPKEFFRLLKKSCSNKLVGMDIVECASERVGTPTALLGAQVIKKVELWRKR
jgi:agmatinase